MNRAETISTEAIKDEIGEGVAEHNKPESERESEKRAEREVELAEKEWLILKKSAENFISRMNASENLTPELKNVTPEILMKLDRAGAGFNYNNMFYKDGATGEVKLCQSGVGGVYGPPGDISDKKYEVFVFDYHTFSDINYDQEAFVLGEIKIDEIREKFDVIPDWVNIEKLKAELRYLKSKGYELIESGVDNYLKDRHEAYKKFGPDSKDYDYATASEANSPDLTAYFGKLGEEKYPLDSEK
jgi:hypothetical protein